MTRLFLRLYAALGLVVLLSLALFVGLGLAAPDHEDLALHELAAFPGAATKALADADTPAAEEGAVSRLSARFEAPVRVEPTPAASARLDAEDQARLARGETVVHLDRSGAFLFTPVPARPFVVILGPTHPAPDGPDPLFVGLAALVLAIAIVAAWTAVPLDRDLRALSHTARALGAGDLDARAHLPAGSPVGEVATTFDTMADRIRALVKGREDLLAAVSHELRSPLQRLRFGLDLLPDAPDVEARVADLQGDVTELDALVDELLAWSRLDGGRAALHLEDVDLDAVLDEAAENARRAREGLEVVVDATDVTVRADARLVRRAVGNLASNGARHATSRLRLVARGHTVEVHDDGPGVPEAERERIFDPFVRLDAARARDTGGIGLGLAMVRRIAEAHDGSIDVTTSPLGGACFTLHLGREARLR